MTTENIMNEIEVKKIEVVKQHLSCKTNKQKNLLIFCKRNATNRFQESFKIYQGKYIKNFGILTYLHIITLLV